MLELGTDLLRFRSVVTSAEQVKEVAGPRLGRGAEEGADRDRAGQDHERGAAGASTPADLAHTFGDPIYVATDVPYRTQAEVDAAAKALAEQIAGAFAEFEGVARGNPKLRAGAAITIDNLGAPFDGKYTITTSRHRFDPTTGYTTAFAVTGRQERSLLGLASGGGGRAGAGRRGRRPRSATPTTRRSQGRVKLTFPWLSDDYVSDWARTVQPGAGKDRGGDGACPRSATRCWSPSSRATSAARTCSAACTTASTPRAGPGDAGRRRLGRGQPPLDGLPARAPDRPARRGRPDRGHHLSDQATTS